MYENCDKHEPSTRTKYLCDGDGNREAKGTIPGVTLSNFFSIGCDPFRWTGFTITADYVLGPAGEELTTLDGSGHWQRTNVYAGGKLAGTYNLESNPLYTVGGSQPAQVPWLHFHLEDWLGTRRMQVSGMLANLGQPETDFQSLPYGDQFATLPDLQANQTANDSTPLHFTGKERDSESGNDYFGARYYASSMGRWLSPDWSAKAEPVPYAKLDDPQSLNLYAYVRNNPLSRVDPNGHWDCGKGGKDAGSLACAVTDAWNKQHGIDTAAASKVNSTSYEQGKSNGDYKAGSNKCNRLPADAVEESGRPRPQVRRGGLLGMLGFTRDPTAHEWADPNVSIPGWSQPKPLSDAQPGDVIAQAHGQWGHVGVVALGSDGQLQTISVNSTTDPAGIVTMNSWGFRPAGGNGEGPGDSAPVVRRYENDFDDMSNQAISITAK